MNNMIRMGVRVDLRIYIRHAGLIGSGVEGVLTESMAASRSSEEPGGTSTLKILIR